MTENNYSLNGTPISSEYKPERKKLRVNFHDYSGGSYFVTICTKDKKHYFGKIRGERMIYSEIGVYTENALTELHTHYNYVEVPTWVVMPNHIHAVIVIRDNQSLADAPGSIPTLRTALGVVVGGFKQSVTRYARRNNIAFEWQKRYHDHIIRDTHDGNYIYRYIENNVILWNKDCFNDT